MTNIKLNKYLIHTKLLFAIFSLLSIVSCSETKVASDACSFTVDSVSIIDSLDQGSTKYYLVHRVAGWSDKTEILELFDEKPGFDLCSKSKIEPLYSDSLEQSKTIKHVYLNINEKTLDIIYMDKEPRKNHNQNLKLEIR